MHDFTDIAVFLHSVLIQQEQAYFAIILQA
jgi:hypothetical protein